MKGVQNPRYMFAKMLHAAEVAIGEALTAAAPVARHGEVGKPSEQQVSAIARGIETFKEAYQTPMTTHMYIAGAAMAPAINRAAEQDQDAVEKLVVRQIPRPSSRNVLVGDVVAFKSPLRSLDGSGSSVMVRRIAALEGEQLVAHREAAPSTEEEEVLEIPEGHCWVLADNQKVKPPQVIDSRTFGYIPLSNIVGRVIFAGSSVHHCRPVQNSDASTEADKPVIEVEVEPELSKLFDDEQPEDEK